MSRLGAWVDPFEHVEVLSLRHSAISSAVQPFLSFALKSTATKAIERRLFNVFSFAYRAARRNISSTRAAFIASSVGQSDILIFF